MELNDILNLDIENLSNKQYDALKRHTIQKLEEVIGYLKLDDLQGVYNMLQFSPDGDGWGSENYFIDFSYKEDSMDLNDILEIMAKLRNIEIKRKR